MNTKHQIKRVLPVLLTAFGTMVLTAVVTVSKKGVWQTT